MEITLEFSGGAELLFDKKKELKVFQIFGLSLKVLKFYVLIKNWRFHCHHHPLLSNPFYLG